MLSNPVEFFAWYEDKTKPSKNNMLKTSALTWTKFIIKPFVRLYLLSSKPTYILNKLLAVCTLEKFNSSAGIKDKQCHNICLKNA